MAKSPETFARLLTTAVHRVSLEESKTIELVQDELGYALGRAGGTAIEYWRKGHIPAQHTDVAHLAQALAERGGFRTPDELAAFLRSANYPDPAQFSSILAPEPAPAAALPFNAVAADNAVPLEALAPFVVGPPVTHPRQFFGRERELRRVFSVLQRFPMQNVAVVGPQRSGKTSLLHYLLRITRTPAVHLRPGQRTDWLPQPEQYRWVFVDFQDARLRRQAGLLSYLLAGLALPTPDPCDLDSFMDTVSTQLVQPTVVLLDEIGAALAAPELDQEFWWSLRSLGSNQTGGRLAFVLTAHELPARLAQAQGKPSPFFNIFGHTLLLGALREAEARELIASSPLPFTPTDVDWIIQQSRCWPAALQLLCHTCLAAREQGEAGDAWQPEALMQLEALHHLFV